MSLPSFSMKDPEEVVVLTIDFVNLLAVGETITTASWLVELADGTAVDSSSVLQGSVDYSAQPLVKQTVKAGVHNTSYLHRAKVVTSAGRTLIGAGLLPVFKGGS